MMLFHTIITDINYILLFYWYTQTTDEHLELTAVRLYNTE